MEDILKELYKERKNISFIQPIHSETDYIRITEAIKKYGVNRTTLNSYSKEYAIRRLTSGKENLMRELDLVEALRKGRKTPINVNFKKKLS